MEKEITYKISLSEYYKQFQTGNGENDSVETRAKLESEINECIKDAKTVAINTVNMSRLDHRPIIVSIDDATFGDWMIGINFNLGTSAEGLFIIDVREKRWIEITISFNGQLAIIKAHDDKQGEA